MEAWGGGVGEMGGGGVVGCGAGNVVEVDVWRNTGAVEAYGRVCNRCIINNYQSIND